MCSIFGIGLLQEHNVNDKEQLIRFVDALFMNCMERGRHASGLAFVSGTNIDVVKKDLKADDLIKTEEYKKCMADRLNISDTKNYQERTLSLIGHCRYQTKGTYTNNLNNHPIVRNEVVGVHNGCISNDDLLFEKYKDRVNRNAMVDSEIIFALIEMYTKELSNIGKAIKKTNSEVRGSLACAAVHVMQPHLIWLFKGTSPCEVFYFGDVGLVVWASQKHFVIDAVRSSEAKFGSFEMMNFVKDELLCLDVYTNKFKKESLTC